MVVLPNMLVPLVPKPEVVPNRLILALRVAPRREADDGEQKELRSL